MALASMLLIDAMKGGSDVYAVCTNDSDLTMPLRLVKDELRLRRNVGLISPMQPKRASNELKQTQPIWHRQITPAQLGAAQLPNELTDDHGIIQRPTEWATNSEGSAEAEPSNQ